MATPYVYITVKLPVTVSNAECLKMLAGLLVEMKRIAYRRGVTLPEKMNVTMSSSDRVQLICISKEMSDCLFTACVTKKLDVLEVSRYH